MNGTAAQPKPFPSILWIPHIAWQVPQRERFFAEALSQGSDIHVTDWDAQATTASAMVRAMFRAWLRPVRISEDVMVHRIRRLSPAPWRWTRVLNDQWYRRQVESLLKRQRIDVVVGSFPVSPPITDAPLVLDVCDDHVAYWKSFGPYPGYADEIIGHERQWAQASSVVVVANSVLKERVMSRYGVPPHRIEVIPNGVDLDEFTPPRDRAVVRRQLGLDPLKKYVGVIGSVSRRPEARRIIRVAEKLRGDQSVQLVVVGAGSELPYLGSEARTRHLGNLVCLGSRSGPELVAYFQALDVGLCPYVRTPGAESASPMRLLHYLAVGVPVVIPRLEAVTRMGLSNVVVSEDDDDAFAARVQEALDLQPQRPIGIGAYDLKALAARYVNVLTRVALG